MHRQPKRSLRCIQRVLVILLPVLALSLIVLLIANSHLNRSRTADFGRVSDDMNISADLTIPAPSDSNTGGSETDPAR